MKPICFYHKSDLDGVCSAAIVKHFVPDRELYGIEYGDEFPWDRVVGMLGERQPDGPATEEHGPSMRWKAKRTVYMVDFSLPPEDMKRLAEVSDLIWIDHHKTAIDLYMADVGDTRESLLRTDFAACELAWAWFTAERGANYEKYTLKGGSTPEVVRLLGAYDSWRKDDPEWDRALAFQYGMRSLAGIYDPECSKWGDLLEATWESDYIELPWLQSITADGAGLLRYQAEVNRKACEAGAHEVPIVVDRWFDVATGEPKEFDLFAPLGSRRGERMTVRALACNTVVFNSQFFEGFFDPEKHDVMCAYMQMADGRWKVSLYSTKPDIDCGAICKAFGGGGHKGAAGFVCEKLPWD